MAIIGRAGPILLAMALVSAAQAQPSEPVATAIAFSVTRTADGKKYPLPVSEQYRLDRDGILQYGAYFFNMPIELNHNDSVEWPAGASGIQVLDSVTQLLRKTGSGLRKIGHDEQTTAEGVWMITASQGGAESTYVIDDKKSPAWTAMDTQFGKLIAEFEKSAGRPKNPYQLPQSPSDH